MVSLHGPRWLLRGLAVLLVAVVVPGVLSVSAFLYETPIRPGEPAPRTVIAPDLIRVADPEATDRARREAAAEVAPRLQEDPEARAAIVQAVRDVFAAAHAVRQRGPDEVAPSRAEQVAALEDRLRMLDDAGLARLVSLTDAQLAQVATDAEHVAQRLALLRISADDLQEVAGPTLANELVVRTFPEGVAEEVVAPVLRDALRPTVRIDEAATAAARQAAADEVTEVQRSYPRGTPIVTAGEPVDEVAYAALRQRGLEGAGPLRALLRAVAVAVVLMLAVAAYLRSYRAEIWGADRKLVLLAVLAVLFTVTLEAATVQAPSGEVPWLYILPVGAVAMLATILFDPPIGVLMTLPVTVLVAFGAPSDPGLVAFAAIASLFSVPLVSRLSARTDLRRAAGQSIVGYAALAAAFVGVFGETSQILPAAAVGAANGVLTAVIVNGSLPFLESVFGILTATSLLDLADRNHPLLRELEGKALGSYNHSIMVSTMVERAARAIGADSLLASVAALYHDIGKVRRPYFFVENQFAISNPHDELEPEVSALIIQEHVTDGVEMGRSHRLPPEVVEGIATHHGTTLVSYFHRQALSRADDPSTVDEEHFRYKGRKPHTRELAVLMLADCCESASRAAAQHNRNLTKADLEGIVTGLIAERVEDGQLDESTLTFRELKIVEASFIETLVGVYHPRIAYPERPAVGRSTGQGSVEDHPPEPTALAGRDPVPLSTPATATADEAER